jgi:hypothetical protein
MHTQNMTTYCSSTATVILPLVLHLYVLCLAVKYIFCDFWKRGTEDCFGTLDEGSDKKLERPV